MKLKTNKQCKCKNKALQNWRLLIKLRLHQKQNRFLVFLTFWSVITSVRKELVWPTFWHLPTVNLIFYLLTFSLKAQLYSLPCTQLSIASDSEHYSETFAILFTFFPPIYHLLSKSSIEYQVLSAGLTFRLCVGSRPSNANRNSWKSRHLTSQLAFLPIINIGCGKEMCPPVSPENFCGSSFLCSKFFTSGEKK